MKFGGIEMITKDMIIGEIMKNYPGADKVLMGVGMHCLGCPSSQMETLQDACIVHGLDVNFVLEQLNK